MWCKNPNENRRKKPLKCWHKRVQQLVRSGSVRPHRRSNSTSSKHWSTAKIFSREMIYCWRFDFTHLLLLCVRSRATPTIGRPLLIEAVERSIWIVSEMQPIFFSPLCPNVISDAAAEMLTSLAGDRHSVCVTRIETPNTSFSIQLIARVRTLCSLCTEHTNHNRN